MACNKDEAFRAKQLAEKKMLAKDFLGAQKIALRAQSLCPDLENVSQMLTVCEVHVSSEFRVGGTEMDWYKILQVDEGSDVSSIKKQYRKLALLLHPDKNKFAGAEAAFKLIGEAQRILLDPGKRALYDIKRKSNFRNSITHQPSRNPAPRQSVVQNNFAAHGTFWTACPFCGTRYQYFRTILNRALRCNGCTKPFIAYDIHSQGANPEWSRPTVTQQNDFSCKVPPRGNTSFATGSHGQTGGGGTLNRTEAGVGENGKGEDTNKAPSVEKQTESETVSSNQKRKSRTGRKKGRKVRSSESEDSTNTSTDDEDINEHRTSDVHNDGNSNNHYLRRSTRKKLHVSYNENEDDVGLGGISDKGNKEIDSNEDSNVRKNTSDDSKKFECHENKNKESDPLQENLPNEKEHSKIDNARRDNSFVEAKTCNGSSTVQGNPEPVFCEYAEPEFHDFEKDRRKSKFEVNQVWGIYDNLDGMPRFYAWIRQVRLPEFKVRITWLEPAVSEENQGVKDWCDKELPISCGQFKLGGNQYTQDHPMFSHIVLCQKKGNNSFTIYPKKGETWALFRHWDIKWSANIYNHQMYKYEIVEILSDYSEGVGVEVTYLIKVKGFVCLFQRMMNNGKIAKFHIAHNELLRFSHLVPSHRLSGEEREGIPEGSFELDPASLPSNNEECVPGIFSENIQSEEHQNIPSSNPPNTKESHTTGKDESNTDENVFECPDGEFNDFNTLRSREKFESGQIWSLYSEEDELPKYYAKIKKVQLTDFKIHLSWLEPIPSSPEEYQWSDTELPFGCGTFMLNSSVTETYTSPTMFSHLVEAAQDVKKKTRYTIHPRKGEVWAIFKNWSIDWELSNLVNAKLDMVEVINSSNSSIEVLILRRVEGHRTVFKAQEKGPIATMVISKSQFLRFSHQIPAFRLTAQESNLNDCWELDPAAMQRSYFA